MRKLLPRTPSGSRVSASLPIDPLLNRRVTKREYRRWLDYAADLGVTNGFYQEGGTAKESFIPAFNYEGVLRTENKKKDIFADIK